MTIADKLLRAKKDYDDVYSAAYENGYSIGFDTGYDNGKAEGGNTKEAFEAGVKQEHKRLWSAIQQGGKRTVYNNEFAYWETSGFYPVFDLILTGSAVNIMVNMTGEMMDLVERLYECGVILDTRGATAFNYAFGATNISRFPKIDTTSASALTGLFYNTKAEIIEEIVLKDDGSQTLSDLLGVCRQLKHIKITGVIGQNLNLQWSTLLTKESIKSFVNALSTVTSGKTLTLSSVAVNKAFETSEGANDGMNAPEWQALTATRSNWTIAYA